MLSKKIAILIGGENRLNFLSNELNNNIQIENYNKYIFTKEFKKKNITMMYLYQLTI